MNQYEYKSTLAIRIPQQAKIQSDVGKKVKFECVDCGKMTDGIIIGSYTGTAKCPYPEPKFFLYPNMRLVQCSVCKMKRALRYGLRSDDTYWENPDEDDYVGLTYREARLCISHNLYTATVMLCRKLIMSLAVDLGATEGATYKEYIKYILDTDLATSIISILEPIRVHGNHTNHYLAPPSEEVAEEIFMITTAFLHTVREEAMNRSADQFCYGG